MQNTNKNIGKINSINFIILLASIFFTSGNLFGQIVISNYTFETGPDNNIFI